MGHRLYPRYHFAMSVYTLPACRLTLPRNTALRVLHILRVCRVTGYPCIDFDILLLWTVNVHIDCLCRSRSRCALCYAGSGPVTLVMGHQHSQVTTRHTPWPRAQFVTKTITNNTRLAKLTDIQSSIVQKQFHYLFGQLFALCSVQQIWECKLLTHPRV